MGADLKGFEVRKDKAGDARAPCTPGYVFRRSGSGARSLRSGSPPVRRKAPQAVNHDHRLPEELLPAARQVWRNAEPEAQRRHSWEREGVTPSHLPFHLKPQTKTAKPKPAVFETIS
jgi:hypothetical protein